MHRVLFLKAYKDGPRIYGPLHRKTGYPAIFLHRIPDIRPSFCIGYRISGPISALDTGYPALFLHWIPDIQPYFCIGYRISSQISNRISGRILGHKWQAEYASRPNTKFDVQPETGCKKAGYSFHLYITLCSYSEKVQIFLGIQYIDSMVIQFCTFPGHSMHHGEYTIRRDGGPATLDSTLDRKT